VQPGLAGGGSAALSAIEVGRIPERQGQLLRDELQRRFEGGGGDGRKIYLLEASMSVRADDVGIEFGTTSPSRFRMTGVANWRLVRSDGDQDTVASGFAKAVDGYDTIDPQYFYSDLQREKTVKRIASALADEITLEISVKIHKNTASE
jgi:hypothetical protein